VAGEPKPSGPKVWNRWLLAVQLVTSPLFVTWTAWVNLDSELKFRNLLFCWLFSLIAGLILLAALFLATNSSSTQLPAPARPFVAFLGFIVSISWISFLATEVVSLLKTFGVILSISDSLLGLTVFAVGNSLGDLIADITVARLGYPVMALSACFGGPMLNILIGIGVGGLYMTLHGRSKATSSVASVVSAMSGTPDKDAYHVVVSRSLLISGVTLVITLLALLICVPLNGWKLDRKLGTGLVALWTVSTICNVIVEVVTEF
jgi:sodium/potassium/calcium exchanger 6